MKVATDNLHEATAQDVFDTVAVHLLTQGFMSMGEDAQGNPKACVYRGRDGAMCAAGVLISDEPIDDGNVIDIINHHWDALNGNGE